MTPSFESTRVADDRVYQAVRQLSHPAGAMYSAAPEDPAHRDGDAHCGRSDDGTGVAQAGCCCTCPLRPENAWRCLSNVGQDPVIYWRFISGWQALPPGDTSNRRPSHLLDCGRPQPVRSRVRLNRVAAGRQHFAGAPAHSCPAAVAMPVRATSSRGDEKPHSLGVCFVGEPLACCLPGHSKGERDLIP